MNKISSHSVTPMCAVLSTAWQPEYRSLKSDNNGFIGNDAGSCDEGWDG